MRIGMMADVYKPHVSGVTNHIALTKKYLEEAGHEVYIFTFGDEDYIDDETNVIRSPGVPVMVPVAEMDVQVNIRHSRSAQYLLHTMDVVHVHHPFLSGQLALRYCRNRGIPIVFTNHTRYDLYSHAYLPWIPEVFGETFLKAYMPNFCRSIDMVVAPSQGMKEILIKLGVNSQIEVVPNGVDLTNIDANLQPFDQSEFGFSPTDIVFTYVGRLGPEKNLPFLLRAFGGVAQAYDNARLLIVGEGPEKENLEDRVLHMGLQEKVQFTGLIPYDQLPNFLLMADVFVTASITEVHPLTVIEAMAAGLPVLGIQSPGVGDTVVDGKTGFLVSDDIAAFTAKMTRLLIEDAERKNMSQQAKIEARKYAIERTSKILVDRYVDVVERKKEEEKSLLTKVILFYDKLRL